MNDYFTYDQKTMVAEGKIPLKVYESDLELYEAMALDMVETIEENNQKNEKTVMIVPVGPTGQYAPFVTLINQRRTSLKQVWFISMDDYLDENDQVIPADHILSFTGFMEREVYQKIDPELLMDPAQRIMPDPKNPAATDELIEKLGKVDACYGGIGINGHIAFNEPEDVSVAEFSTRPTRVLSISPETRTVNTVGSLKGALQAMPTRCVTIGMKQILMAKKIRLACFRNWHPGVVRHALFGEVSAHFPATLLQNHPDVLLTINSLAAQVPYERLVGDDA